MGGRPPPLVNGLSDLVKVQTGIWRFPIAECVWLSLRFDKIQRCGLRAVMGYMQSTPINVIFSESKEPPLFIRNRYLCRNFLTRVALTARAPLLTLLDSVRDGMEPLAVSGFASCPLTASFLEMKKKMKLLPQSVPPPPVLFGVL